MYRNIRIIDTHAHILPGADHGSTGIDNTVKQIKMAEDAFVDVIIATPHFYCHVDTPELFNKRREKAVSLINEYKAGCDDKLFPEIKVAAEVAIEEELFSLTEEEVESLCIQGTRNIMLELPLTPWEDWVYKFTDKFSEKYKVNPVLVHLDRYDRDNIDRLLCSIKTEFRSQVNAYNLIKKFNKKHLIKMIDGNVIQVLGSDIHGTGDHYESFRESFKVLGARRTLRMMKNATKLISETA